MKKYIRLIQVLFFLTFSIYLSAQEFAPTGAKWYYSHSEPYNCSLMTKMESVGTTTIDGIDCKILETKQYFCTGFGEELILDSVIRSTDYFYKENDKIYHYDPFADDFVILYDFTVNPGDTITVRDTTFEDCDDINLHPYYYYCSSFIYTVDSTEIVDVSGYNLKKIHTHSYWRFLEGRDWGFSYQTDPKPIIENIGSELYWFGDWIVTIGGGEVSSLRCYEDENIFYRTEHWPEPYPCDSIPGFILTSIKDMSVVDKVSTHPNPFSSSTTIEYSLSSQSQVTLSIFNSFGELIHQVQEHQQPGKQQIRWDAKGIPAGVYFYRLEAGEQTATGKLLLMK